MNVLGIDQSPTKMGFCLVDLQTYQPNWCHLMKPKAVGIQLFNVFHETIAKIIKKSKPIAVAYEEPIAGLTFYEARNYGIYRLVDAGRIVGLVMKWLNEFGYDETKGTCLSLPISTWRKINFGNTKKLLGKNADQDYLEVVKELTGFAFDNDDIADAYMIGRAAAIVYKVIMGIVLPWDLDVGVVEALLDSTYIKEVHTSKKTVATRIVKDKNLELFKNFSRYARASWGHRISMDSQNRFGKSIIVNDYDGLAQFKKLPSKKLSNRILREQYDYFKKACDELR